MTLSNVGPEDVGTYEGIAQNLAGDDRVEFQLVVLEPVVSSAYMEWATHYGLDPLTDGAPNADVDGDIRTNRDEFALGTGPSLPDGPPVRAESTDAGIRVAWLQHPDLVYESLVGTELGAVFEPVAVTASGELGAGDVPEPHQRFEVVLPLVEHDILFVLIRAR